MRPKEIIGQNYCFIESFDSVRYAELTPEERRAKEIQAEVELIYSLLLGQRIVVPEAHSFDSIGFLEIVTEALDARPQNLVLEQEWIRQPFLLSLRATYFSYPQMVAETIKRPGFILSAMSEINDDISLRHEIANNIQQNNFSSVERLLQNNANEKCVKIMDQVRRLSDYFSELEKREAKNLGNLLEQYVSNLIDNKNISDTLMKEIGFSDLQAGLMTLKKFPPKTLTKRV